MNKSKANWILGIVLLIMPFLLWLIPAGQFDDSGVVICPSRFIFDIECFGCGMTRAVLHMHHWDYEQAVYYNMFILIVYPLLVGFWIYWMYQIGKNLGFINS